MLLTSLVFILCIGNIISQSDCKTSVASEAIVNILKTQFSGNWQSKVDLIYFGDAIKVADKILHRLPVNLSLKVIDGGAGIRVKDEKLPEGRIAYSRDSEDIKFLPWNNVLRKSSVLLFESAQQYKRLIANITWLGNRWFRYNHIAYAPDLTATDVIETTKNGFEIDAVAFLVNETVRSIELVSSYMFTEQKCRHIQLKTINRFNILTSKWETTKFYPRKYNDLLGCNLTFVKKPAQRENPNILAIVSEASNFNLVPSDLVDLEYEKHNASTTDLIERLNFIFFPVTSSEIITTPIMVTKVFCYLPDGEPYSLLEKMFMMFDDDVWIAIGCTLLFWFISIRVINLMPKKIQTLVYGTGITTPTMNLIDIFLNGGQRVVPTGKLARYLLLLFVTWSLIFRTCYQSKLFEYLQSDLRREIVNGSLEDLVSNKTKYTSITPGPELNAFQCLDIVAEYSNKNFFACMDHVVDQAHATLRSGQSSLRMHEEALVTWYWMMSFFEFSPFFEEFNDKIGRIISGGLLDNWKMLEKPKQNVAEDIGPQVLTFDQLMLGFFACSVLLALSIIVFIVEITGVMFVTLNGNICFLFALKTYNGRYIG